MKQDSEEHLRNRERIEELVNKFESETNSNETLSVWFDSEDIEDICNYYIDSGNIVMAERVLKLGEQLHPTDELIRLLRVHLLIEERKPEEALALLEVLNYSADFYWNYLRLGALADLDRWTEAKEAADAAICCDNNRPAAALDIARVFYDRNQQEQALHYLLLADNDSECEPDVVEAIVQCLCELNRFTEALPFVDRLIDQNPYSSEAWQMRSSIHIDLGRYDLALDDLEYAVAISPNKINLLIAKVKLLLTLERDTEALKMLSQIETESPEWSGICTMLRGDMYFWSGDYKKAYSYYRKGFDRDFFYADSVMRYFECTIELKKWKEAVATGNCLLKYSPYDLKLLERLSDVHFELKQYSVSAKLLRRCLRMEPDNVYLLLRYGSLLLDMRNIKKAYTAIHKAYRMAPDACQTNLLMAVICYLRQENKRMYRYYRKACKIDQSAHDTFLQLCPDLKPYIDRLDSITRQCEKNGITDIDSLIFKN